MKISPSVPFFPALRLAAFLAAGAALSFGSAGARAAVMTISDATYAGLFTAGTPENITGDATVASITTAEGTYSTLVGAAATAVTSSYAANSLGDAPASVNAAASGLTINDGVNNMGSGDFQFGLGTSGFTASTRFFIIENTPVSSTGGDPITIQLVNAANTVIGTYTLTLSAANFTSSAANTTSTALATLTYTVGTAAGTAQKLTGVSFSLADLGVTDTSLISSATGIYLSNAAASLDPNVVGLYTVPEPGVWALMSGGLGSLGVWSLRRRRASSLC